MTTARERARDLRLTGAALSLVVEDRVGTRQLRCRRVHGRYGRSGRRRVGSSAVAAGADAARAIAATARRMSRLLPVATS